MPLLATVSLEVWAALQAAAFAQAIGLPQGNMWEPAIARNMQRAVEAGEDRASVKRRYLFQLGASLHRTP